MQQETADGFDAAINGDATAIPPTEGLLGDATAAEEAADG